MICGRLLISSSFKDSDGPFSPNIRQLDYRIIESAKALSLTMTYHDFHHSLPFTKQLINNAYIKVYGPF